MFFFFFNTLLYGYFYTHKISGTGLKMDKFYQPLRTEQGMGVALLHKNRVILAVTILMSNLTDVTCVALHSV